MKVTKSAWVIWGVVSTLALALAIGGYWVHSSIYRVVSSACIFAPVFVGVAFSNGSKRKP